MDRLKEMWKRDYMTVLAYVFLVVSLCMVEKFYVFQGDDLRRVGEGSIWSLTVELYKTWEGSWATQFVVFAVCRYIWSFRILNVLICILLTWSLAQLMPSEKYRHVWAVFLFMLFPMGSMTSAGPAVTSIVYLWVAAFGIYALTLTFRVMRGIKIRLWEYILGTLALLFGSNREQSGILILLFLTCIICYGWLAKTNWKMRYIYFQWVITLINIISVMLAPAIKIKSWRYTTTSYPNFGMLTLGEKILEGILVTLNYFLTHCHPIVLLLVILLAVMIFKKYDEFSYRIVSIFPVAYLIGSWITPWRSLEWMFAGSELISAYNVDNIKSYIAILLQFMWLGCVLAEIWWSFENTKEFWLILFALVAGFASTAVLGITGTAHILRPRVYSFFHWVIIAVTLFIICKNRKFMEDKVAMFITFIWSGLSVLNYIQALRIYGGSIYHWMVIY